jgi:type IV pilus assembly protein PilA
MLAKALRKRLSKEEKGFTLIELLAVIVIIGIIAVIAVPLIGNVISNSKEDADLATARQLYDAARLYVIGEANGDYVANTEVTLAELQTGHYIDGTIVLPSTKATLIGATTVVTFDANGTLVSVALDPPPASGTYSAADILTD